MPIALVKFTSFGTFINESRGEVIPVLNLAPYLEDVWGVRYSSVNSKPLH